MISHLSSVPFINRDYSVFLYPSVSACIFFCRRESRVPVLRGGCKRRSESVCPAGDHYGGSAEVKPGTYPRSPPHPCLPSARATLPAGLLTGTDSARFSLGSNHAHIITNNMANRVNTEITSA